MDPLLTAPTGLSTLCPRRRSPDNQVAVGNRVGNPIDGLGRWPLPPLATPPAVLCSRWAAIGSPWGTVRSEHRPNQNSRAGVAEVQQKRRRAMIEHRPFQIAEWGFPPFAHRASFFWGSAPWTKRGKRATSGAFPGAGRQPIATAPDWSEHRPNQNPRSSRGGERAGGSACRKEHRPFQSSRKVRRTASILLTYTVLRRRLSPIRSTRRWPPQ